MSNSLLDRPRVRTVDHQEVRLGSYEMFHRGEPLTETVREKLMLGLSTGTYGTIAQSARIAPRDLILVISRQQIRDAPMSGPARKIVEDVLRRVA